MQENKMFMTFTM